MFEKNPKFLFSEAFILPFSRSKTQFPVEINVMSSSSAIFLVPSGFSPAKQVGDFATKLCIGYYIKEHK